MSLKIKVYGGTTTENICLKCVNLEEIQGLRKMDCIRKCAAQKGEINFPVARCSYYREKEPDLSKYKKALNLKFDKKTSQLLVVTNTGFFQNEYQTVAEYRAQCEQNEMKAIEEEQKLKQKKNHQPKTMSASAGVN